jgi:hypothetical protein
MVLGKSTGFVLALYLALGRQKLAKIRGLIRRRWGDARTAPGELEAAF